MDSEERIGRWLKGRSAVIGKGGRGKGRVYWRGAVIDEGSGGVSIRIREGLECVCVYIHLVLLHYCAYLLCRVGGIPALRSGRYY